MRLTRILPIILLLTACAPAAPVPTATAVPPTETSVPTSEPTSTLTTIPTSTSTPEPTATLTATPFRIPEGAVRADGALVFVEDGKLYKVDASGARTETEMSREVFTNVFEAGDLVKQLHPEYFGEDQSALKEELLPKGVNGGNLFGKITFGFVHASDKEGSVNYRKYTGKVLDVVEVNRVKQRELIAFLAVFGSQTPVPHVLAFIENDQLRGLSEKMVINTRKQLGGNDSLGKNNLGSKSFNDMNVSELRSYLDNKVISPSFVANVLKRDVYSESSIYNLDLNENEIDIIYSSEIAVENAKKEFDSKNIKTPNVGVEIEGTLDEIRKDGESGFFGFFPYEDKLILIAEEK